LFDLKRMLVISQSRPITTRLGDPGLCRGKTTAPPGFYWGVSV